MYHVHRAIDPEATGGEQEPEALDIRELEKHRLRVELLNKLTEDEIVGSTILTEYTDPRENSFYLLLQNNTTDELILLYKNHRQEALRLNLPSSPKDLPREARRALRIFPAEIQEAVKERYKYLRDTRPAETTAAKRERGRKTGRGNHPTNGMHRRFRRKQA